MTNRRVCLFLVSGALALGMYLLAIYAIPLMWAFISTLATVLVVYAFLGRLVRAAAAHRGSAWEPRE